MLDVHAPQHAASTWRDFFIHIATIVLGLLIAVGLEQAVEYFHHRREVAETREALRLEREDNRKAFSAGMSEFNRQTAALENNLLVLHFLQQHPGTPQDKLPGILVWHARRLNLSDSAWKTAQQSNVTALMPQDEVRNLAATYERIDAVARGFDDIWPVII
jgi:type II secretory pathway pseudopilin PulG